MKTTFPSHGFTRTELLVALVVLGVLIFAWLAIPGGGCRVKGTQVQALCNAKQIHLATFCMAEDGIKTSNKALGWPGDLVSSRTMPCTVSSFVKVLVNNEYLKPNDLRIFGAAGIALFTGSDTNKFVATPGPGNNCAFTVYCIQQSDAADAIFLSTINATLDVSSTTFSIDAKAQPFGDKGYVIFHKGGDGQILRKEQAKKPNLQGTPCKMAFSGTAALRPE